MTTPTPLPSFAQEQLWFIDEFHHGLPAHNVPFLIRLRGPLDVDALSRALAALAARHEPLRTRLVAGKDGHPVRVIDEPGPWLLEADSLTEAGLRELAEAESLRPFRLADDHPLRVRLVRLATEEHALVLVAHQTAFDDRSAGVFMRDLAAAYAGTEPPEPRISFAGHALRERQHLQGDVLTSLEEYWRKTLAGFETSRFPADRPRPLLADHTGAVEHTTLDPAVLGRLRELSAREGTTLPVTLLAALLVLLHRYTGQTDLIAGTTGIERADEELAGLIGYLGDILPIRADTSGNPAFRDFLAHVSETVAAARAHQDLPFAKVVEALDIDRDPGRFPLFQTAFGYTEPIGQIEAGGITFGYERIPLQASRYDIAFAAESHTDGLRVEATYTPALFDAATVRRMLAHYEVLLRGVADDPAAALSKLPVLTEAELRAELHDWNDTRTDLPVQCIHEGIQERAAAMPDAVAAEYEAGWVSYADLNRQANQVARRLRELGVGPEVLVGVCMSTGLRRLAALLGTWKAGGGYVPLDPALPADRLSFMIADTGMRVILTDEPSRPSVPESAAKVVSLDAEWDQITGLDGADLTGTGVNPDNVAYVIYTSGSTGQPKGVVVEHGQAIHFLHGMARHWRIGPGGAVLAFAAFTFDVSVMDMFMPLLGGAKVVLAAPQTLHSPPRLAALMRTARITFACLPPTVLNLLIGEDFPELRTLLSSGEELSSELLKAWLHIGADIYNGYGPTECSIGSVFMKLEPDTPLPPPIGRPKPNYRAYVLDAHLNPVPVGVTGELHIGGPGVSRGYLNRPDLTRERFIPDPFRPGPGARLYKTGDLARRRPDGTLVFAGRIDNQVKIRGLRVEPGEIESALMTHPGIAQAVVIVVTDQAGVQQLAGYLRPADGGAELAWASGRGEPSVADVRRHLAQSLPGYMIPAYLVMVAELPLTAHGKIDKAALPPPVPASATAERVPPRTMIEAVLTDLFATVLGVREVSVTDGFFEAGGNSLQAMRLVTELRTALAADLDITAVFLTPTPRQLAAELRDKHGFVDEDLGPDGIEGLDRRLQDNPV
ncbi:MAG: amino acid adenylation domain-containing protein [Streptosporangiaceae bacterium]|nr:amino acid adenylation domain-containing protein [Streptosporangiaceae bacterium]